MTLHEYNSCVDMYADAVYRFILKNIRDEETAQDVVQDAFARLWEHVKEIAADKARSFLFTTAYRCMIDNIRRDNRLAHYKQSLQTTEPETENSYSDVKEILDVAVMQLPEIQRSVLLLRDYEGYSYDEIGEITHLNETQVKVYIYRARTFLKEYIGKLDLVL